MPQRFRSTCAFALCCVLVLLSGCAPSPTRPPSDAPLEVVFLQINDIYEIGALSGGRIGGLARVKTLKDQELARHPNTLLVLAGDFLSPSALGSATFDQASGATFAGRQMVDVLNAAALDIAVFGNHEFDVGTAALDQRIDEARFTWLAGNVRAAEGAATYHGLPRTHIVTARAGDRTLRIGIVAATLPTVNKKTPAGFDDVLESVAAQIDAVDAGSDVIVAITHLPISQDRELARRYPQLALIMGGHEHNRNAERVGDVQIAKADSNARSVARHLLRYDPATAAATVTTAYIDVDAAIAEDAIVAQRVADWMAKANVAFKASGIDAARVVTTLDTSLDGLSAHVRHQQTDLGTLIGKALLPYCPDAHVAFFNSGAIRVDDRVGPGAITEYDVLRIAPFEDHVACARVRGGDLKSYLDHYLARTGTGDFMQIHGIANDGAGWTYADGSALADDAVIPVATNTYVAEQMQLPAVQGSVVKKDDLRRAVIEYLRASD